jgi:integrase/recombinase XerD
MDVVRSLLAFGHQHGYLPANVARHVCVPLVRRRLVGCLLPANVVERILAREPDRPKRLLLQLLYTGTVRVEEVCGLRWQDLHEHADGGEIVIRSREGERRSITLGSALWRELTALRGTTRPQAHVFRIDRTGRPVTRILVESVVATAARRAGLPGCSITGVRLLALSGSERAAAALKARLVLRSAAEPSRPVAYGGALS